MFQFLTRAATLQFVRTMRWRYDDGIRFIAGRIFANARRALPHWVAVRIGRAIGLPRTGNGACKGEGRLLVALECGGLEAADRRRSRCSSKQVGWLLSLEQVGLLSLSKQVGLLPSPKQVGLLSSKQVGLLSSSMQGRLLLIGTLNLFRIASDLLLRFSDAADGLLSMFSICFFLSLGLDVPTRVAKALASAKISFFM